MSDPDASDPDASDPVSQRRSHLGTGTIAALSAGLTIGYLAGNMLPEVVDALVDDLGLTPSVAGGITTAALVATAVAGTTYAHRATRSGRGRSAVVGAGLVAVGYAAAALAPGTAALGVSLVVAGFGGGIVLANTTAATTATGDPDKAVGTAVLISTLVGAVMLLALPILTGGNAATLMLALMVTGLAVIPLVRRLPDHSVEDHGPVGPLPHRGIGAAIFAGVLLLYATDNGMWAYLGTIGTEVVGLSGNAVGLVLALGYVAGFLGALLQVVVGKRWGRFGPIVVLVIVDTVAKVAIVMLPFTPAFGTSQLVWSFAHSALFAFLLACGAALDHAGRWAAIIGAAFAFGSALGPVMTGVIGTRGGVATFVIVTLVCGAGVLLLLGPASVRLDRIGPRSA